MKGRLALEVDILGMLLKLPKNEGGIRWTKHAQRKMRQYQLSEKRVLRVLRKPDRKEEGIAEGTLANMQTAGTKKHPTEIWTMYQILKKPPHQSKHGTGQAKCIKIISAWRYPAISPKGKSLPIPDDVFQDLIKEGLI